jgi:hypothetical protein
MHENIYVYFCIFTTKNSKMLLFASPRLPTNLPDRLLACLPPVCLPACLPDHPHVTNSRATDFLKQILMFASFAKIRRNC